MKKSQNQKQNCCQLLQGQLKRATKHDQIKAKKPKKKKQDSNTKLLKWHFYKCVEVSRNL